MHSIVATVNRPATAPVTTIGTDETYCEPHMRRLGDQLRLIGAHHNGFSRENW